jgi:signal peptidase I
MSRTKAFALLVVAAITVVVAVVLLRFMADVELISYGRKDMEPTIGQNERILISKRIDQIQRGDIVIFRYPGDLSQTFVKRVIGLPGERVVIQNGRVFIDRQPLDERYLGNKIPLAGRSSPEFEIPHGSYYILGDNRDASNDSRMWGPLSADLIYGKVMFK